MAKANEPTTTDLPRYAPPTAASKGIPYQHHVSVAGLIVERDGLGHDAHHPVNTVHILTGQGAATNSMTAAVAMST